MQKRWKVGAVLTGVVVIAVGACDTGEIVADAMVDAGQIVRDAGDAMIDASGEVRDGAGDDAQAQPPEAVLSMELACDVVREEVDRHEDSRLVVPVTETRHTYWYAELSEPTITTASVRSVSVVACGLEQFAEEPSCTPGTYRTCTGDPPFPRATCRTVEAEVDDGRVRVQCGYRRSTRESEPSAPGGLSPWVDAPGERFQTARLTVVLE